MKTREIHRKIGVLISENRLEGAIVASKCVVINQDYASSISLLSRNFFEAKNQQIQFTQEERLTSIKYNDVAHRLTELIKDLPSDFDLIINRIKYEASYDLKIDRAFDIIRVCLPENNACYVEEFESDLRQIQQENLVSGNLDEDSLNKLISSLEELKNRFLEYLEGLNISFFKENFAEEFFQFALTEKNFHYRLPSSKPSINISEYFNDIKISNETNRTYLLLWEEEYLSGNPEKSLDYVNRIRIETGYDNSMIYEYTALSFLDTHSASKILNQVLVNKDSSKFDKLKLYLLRAISLDQSSSTLNNSLEYIFRQLLLACEKIYNNINFDYIFDPPEKGRSKRRDILKRLFEFVRDILHLFEKYSFSKDDFIFTVLTELEGGGKYGWLSIRNNEIINRVGAAPF